MLHCVALVRTDISEELIRATQCNIPEDTILHSHRRENLKSYIIKLVCFSLAVWHNLYIKAKFIKYPLLQCNVWFIFFLLKSLTAKYITDILHQAFIQWWLSLSYHVSNHIYHCGCLTDQDFCDKCEAKQSGRIQNLQPDRAVLKWKKLIMQTTWWGTEKCLTWSFTWKIF
jgi:hypothetical protein